MKLSLTPDGHDHLHLTKLDLLKLLLGIRLATHRLWVETTPNPRPSPPGPRSRPLGPSDEAPKP